MRASYQIIGKKIRLTNNLTSQTIADRETVTDLQTVTANWRQTDGHIDIYRHKDKQTKRQLHTLSFTITEPFTITHTESFTITDTLGHPRSQTASFTIMGTVIYTHRHTVIQIHSQPVIRQ